MTTQVTVTVALIVKLEGEACTADELREWARKNPRSLAGAIEAGLRFSPDATPANWLDANRQIWPEELVEADVRPDSQREVPA